MWMAALFGMATKYAECLLAVKYREQDANGQMAGDGFTANSHTWRGGSIRRLHAPNARSGSRSLGPVAL